MLLGDKRWKRVKKSKFKNSILFKGDRQKVNLIPLNRFALTLFFKFNLLNVFNKYIKMIEIFFKIYFFQEKSKKTKIFPNGGTGTS